MDKIKDKEATAFILDEKKLAKSIASNLLNLYLENSTNNAQFPYMEGDMIRGRVPVGIDDNGNPIMKQVQAKNEFEFMIKAGNMMLASGMLCIPKKQHTHDVKTPFEIFAEHWFQVYKSDNKKLKPATKNDYRYMLDQYIFPSLGKLNIEDITTTHIQEMLNKNSRVAATSQTRILITLRQIFNMAIQEHIITVNPAKGNLSKTGVEKKDGRSLTHEEWLNIQRMLPEMQEADRMLISLMMYEGLRRGEAIGLLWDNVDYKNNCIHIVQQAAYNGNDNNATIQLPKTKKSIRDVPLVLPLKTILQSTVKNGKYIVGNSNTPYTKSMLTKAMARVKKMTGITDLHPHTFRYSHATILHEIGVDDKTIQAWEGHASQSTTTNFYIKNSQSMTNKAEAALSDFATSQINFDSETG